MQSRVIKKEESRPQSLSPTKWSPSKRALYQSRSMQNFNLSELGSKQKAFLPEKRLFGAEAREASQNRLNQTGTKGTLLDRKNIDEVLKYSSPDKRLAAWRQQSALSTQSINTRSPFTAQHGKRSLKEPQSGLSVGATSDRSPQISATQNGRSGLRASSLPKRDAKESIM